MKTLKSRALATTMAACVLLLIAFAGSVKGQARVYRGSIGGRNIEMRLDIQGSNVSGTYTYDSIGEELKVTGHFDSEGRLELTEFVKKTQTGKFACKHSLDVSDPECTWTKPDGSREAYVTLSEQHAAFTSGLKVTPKTITDRKSGVRVSYPQLTSGDQSPGPGAEGFNRRILSLVQKEVKEFEPGPEANRNSFEINYSVLFANDNVISVEMNEYSDSGGAHPNSLFWALNYDLPGNRELSIDDLFKPNSDYQTAIAKYVAADIDKRADALEQEEAKREGRKPKQRDDSFVSVDQLSEISAFALTPTGLQIYFDLPHVIAYFDKNFVPYSVLRDYLKPNVPASRFDKP